MPVLLTSSFTLDDMLLGGFGLCIMVVLAIVGFSYYQTRKGTPSELLEVTKARKKEERKIKRYMRVYNFLNKIPFVKSYIQRIESSYLYLCPYDIVVLTKLVAKTITKIVVFSIGGAVVVLLFNSFMQGYLSAYAVACACLIVYVLSNEVLHSSVRSKDKQTMSDLIKYFANVKHQYLACKNIPQSILSAAEGMSYEVNMHALELHSILTANDRREKVREYTLNPRANSFMKLFISQAYEASERGDVTRPGDESSLLARNMEFLRVEMMREAARREKRDYKFAGYSFVAAAPVFFLMPLKKWGVDFSPEMQTFYIGLGNMVMLLAFVATILVYDSINKVKELQTMRTVKNMSIFDSAKNYNAKLHIYMDVVEKQKAGVFNNMRKMLRETGTNETVGAMVVKMAVYAVVGTIFGIVLFTSIHKQNRELITTRVDNLDSIVYTTSKKQENLISECILAMTTDYLNVIDVELDVLKADLNERIYLPNEDSVSGVCLEVQRRVKKYHSEYFRWYDFLISLVLGTITATLPYMSLKYRYSVLLKSKGDEVRQFQSIVIMERTFTDITVRQMLEEMETFAVLFKSSIRRCLNNYSAGPTEALLELKDQEKDCSEFTELIDGFLVIESVGVTKAFAEVQSNREMSEGSRAFYEDMLLDKKKGLTDMLSIVPAGIAFGLYFLVPLCYYAFGGVSNMFDMLQEFSNY